MLIEHRGKRPKVDSSAYVAPNATLCGDVTIGADSRILFGVVIVAAGGPVQIGSHCIVMENAVIRGTVRHPTASAWEQTSESGGVASETAVMAYK